jgi:hypothetical protein
LNLLNVVISRYTENDEIFRLLLFLAFNEPRDLLLEGATPSSPEIQQNYLTLEAGGHDILSTQTL